MDALCGAASNKLNDCTSWRAFQKKAIKRKIELTSDCDEVLLINWIKVVNFLLEFLIEMDKESESYKY